ncbi:MULTISPECIES: recombinase family protein [unclassified Kitasatospora]|uniref:recombinase family protein n=1 Tax=unclassified Kitasatospora TaxID=2633591 RepID=UPI002475C483|nr:MULTISPECIES: recombinase family protein [unclassified Kitasatospora]MDH6123872.1 DNA invertase Pin-like site-specific DNA recombinase [Kitasatospora sp. GP82]MDH6576029.1 DNA invertase Pin-like site-specific DNA recombinase [Kitasatospora sp. MAP5-34]
MATHAGVYTRQSEQRANQSEASTEDQRERSIERAKALGAVAIECYDEELGTSAFDGKVRPVFERMLNDCRAGRINMIVVYYVARFSRIDPLDAIPVVSELLNLGVTIVSVNEGQFRKGNLMDLIHLIMRLDAAHQESRNKSVAVSGAKKLARELGGYTGGKAPYGFRLEPHTVTRENGRPVVIQKLAVEESEAAVIRQIAEDITAQPLGQGQWFSGEGVSITSIAAKLDAQGIPTRGQTVGKKFSDSRWAAQMIRRVLKDPRIAGYAAEPQYGTRKDGTPGTTVVGYKLERDPETMKPITAHPQIITPEAWYSIQQWLETRTRTGERIDRGQSLVTGLGIALCECGALLKTHGMSNRHGTHYRQYRCSRVHPEPGKHAGNVSISQTALDDYVARRVFALIQNADGDPDTHDVLQEAARRFGRATERPDRAAERSRIVAERAEVVAALEELYDERDEGGFRTSVGRARFLRSEKTLEGRLMAVEARLADLEEAEAPALPLGEWVGDDPDADPIGPGSWWHGASVMERRAFFKLFISRITLYKAPHRGGQPRTMEAMAQRVRVEWVHTQKEAEEE